MSNIWFTGLSPLFLSLFRSVRPVSWSAVLSPPPSDCTPSLKEGREASPSVRPSVSSRRAGDKKCQPGRGEAERDLKWRKDKKRSSDYGAKSVLKSRWLYFGTMCYSMIPSRLRINQLVSIQWKVAIAQMKI